jgi:hypothetical protein
MSDEVVNGSDASAPPPDPWFGAPPAPRTARTWAVAGVGTVVIGAVTFLGVDAVASRWTTAAGSADPVAAGRLPGGLAGSPVGGDLETVAEVSGSTVSLRSVSGDERRVEVGSDTTVVVSSPATLDDLDVGDQVIIIGFGVGEIDAMAVVVDRSGVGSPVTPASGRLPGGPAGGPSAGGAAPAGGQAGPAPVGGQSGPAPANFAPIEGRVTALGAGRITVSVGGREVEVAVGSATSISVARVGTVDDLTAGDVVVVEARQGKVATIRQMGAMGRR